MDASTIDADVKGIQGVQLSRLSGWSERPWKVQKAHVQTARWDLHVASGRTKPSLVSCMELA